MAREWRRQINFKRSEQVTEVRENAQRADPSNGERVLLTDDK